MKILLIILYVILGLLALFLGVMLLFWIFFTICAFTINRKKQYEDLNPFYSKVFLIGYKVLTWLSGTRIKATGVEQVPFGQRFLLISNHRSRFDNFCHIVTLDKENFAYVSKPENFKIPIVNYFMTRCLYISINRGNPKDGLLAILRASQLIKDGIVSIGVFPEGTRSKDLKLGEFKPGCFKIATKTLCPIVVCCTQGTEKIHKNFPFKRTQVKLDIIKVLYPKDYEGKSTVEISDYVRSLIQTKLDENQNEEGNK